MKTLNTITLLSLIFLGACNPALDNTANNNAKLAPTNECADNPLVGVHNSEVTTVTATAACELTLEDHDGGCTMGGTFSILNGGEDGSVWFNVTNASEGCELVTPHSFELWFEIDGESIGIGLN